MDWFSELTSWLGNIFSPTDTGVGDYFGWDAGAAPAVADAASSSVLSDVSSALPTSWSDWGGNAASTPAAAAPGVGGTIMNVVKEYGPKAAMAGVGLYGANKQAGMYKGINEGNNAAYEKYLGNLQTPEAVKSAQYGAAQQKIGTNATTSRRRLTNQLSARGVKGEGMGAPLAADERTRQREELQAWLDIYGKYNPPQVAPPASYAPSTADLFGKQAGDVGTAMLLKSLFG